MKYLAVFALVLLSVATTAYSYTDAYIAGKVGQMDQPVLDTILQWGKGITSYSSGDCSYIVKVLAERFPEATWVCAGGKGSAGFSDMSRYQGWAKVSTRGWNFEIYNFKN